SIPASAAIAEPATPIKWMSRMTVGTRARRSRDAREISRITSSTRSDDIDYHLATSATLITRTHQWAGHAQSSTSRNLSEFAITETELALIAALAIIAPSRRPKNG